MTTGTLTEDQLFESWAQACHHNGGETTVPPHQEAEYIHIAERSDAHNGWKDRPEDGIFKSQCTISHPEFGTLVFNFVGDQPIFVR